MEWVLLSDPISKREVSVPCIGWSLKGGRMTQGRTPLAPPSAGLRPLRSVEMPIDIGLGREHCTLKAFHRSMPTPIAPYNARIVV